MKLSKFSQTFFSGWIGATIAMNLLVGGFCALVVADPQGYLDFFIPGGLLLTVCLLITYGSVMISYGKWSHSVTITDTIFRYRNLFTTTEIPVDHLVAMRFVLRQQRKGEPKSVLKIAYRNTYEKIENIEVPLYSFSKRVQKKFFAIFTAHYGAVPFHTSLIEHLDTLDIHPANPVIAEFPYLIDRQQHWTTRWGIKINFSETTLFLMAAALITLFIIDSTPIFNDLSKVLDLAAHTRKGGYIIIFLGLMGLGLLLSLYHILIRGKKSRGAQFAMLFFGVGMSAGAGILSGMSVWQEQHGWANAIFAIQNCLYGFVLLAALNPVDLDSQIQQRDARFPELLIGMVVTAIIVYLGAYHFHAYWAFTFSACIAYVTMINTPLERWMLHKYKDTPGVGFNVPLLGRLEEQVMGWASRHRFMAMALMVILFFVALWGLSSYVKRTHQLTYADTHHVHITKRVDLQAPTIGFYYQGDDGRVMEFALIREFIDSVAPLIASHDEVTYDTLTREEEDLAYQALDEQWAGSFRPLTLIFLTKYSQGELGQYHDISWRQSFLSSRPATDDHDFWEAIFELYDYLESQKTTK